MPHRSPLSRLRVEQLEDRTTPSGSQIPAGEFNWTQYSPNGTLGQLIWQGQALVYRTRTAGAWRSEIVAVSDDFTESQYNTRDEVQTASQTAQLVYTSNGVPHVLFLEEQFHWQTNTFQTFIRHYARGANGWRMVETITPAWRTTWGPNNLVAEAGPNNSIHLIFTETNAPATAVGQFGTGLLSYATNQGGNWAFSRIARTADLNFDVWIMGMRYAPRFLSLAVDARGKAHVTYTPQFTISGPFGTVSSVLRYATNATGSWVSETAVPAIDGSADAGLGASVAVAPNGTVAVASYYVDRFVTGSPEQSWLMYSTRRANGTWNTVNAVSTPDGYVGRDGPGFTGFAPQLSFDAQSRPTIVFSDEASEHLPVSFANELAGQIRSATLVNGSWATQTVYRQTNPLTNQMFYPVAATHNGQTVYAGLRVTSVLDANRNPVRVDVGLVDVNAPGGSPPVTPPTVPPPPPSSPPPPNPPPPARPRPILLSGSDAGPTTIVRVDYSDGSRYVWTPFGIHFNAGASVARGDVNRDGIDDIIVASGPGIPGMVRVWSGANRRHIADYTPLGGFGGGLTVAAGDVNGDGAADIVVGVAGGGWPVVTAISGANGRTLGQFLAYGTGYSGGVRLDVGDVNDDGRADIAVATAAGTAARVRVFNGQSIWPGQQPVDLIAPFFPFTSLYRGGLNVAVGDVTGDGYADVVVGNGTGAGRFQVYSGAALVAGDTTLPLVTQLAWPSDGRGVRVAFIDDTDGDGRDELVLHGPARRWAARLLSSHLTAAGWPEAAYEWFDPLPDTGGGVYVG